MNISISAMEVGIIIAICENDKGEFSLETMCLDEEEGAKTNTPLVFQSLKEAMLSAAKIIQNRKPKKKAESLLSVLSFKKPEAK